MNSARMQEVQAPAWQSIAFLDAPVPSGVVSKTLRFPGKTLIATIALVKRVYGPLKHRYGPRYSKALVVAVFIALFLPIPGSTLLVIGIIAAIAECHRVISRTPPSERLRRAWRVLKRGVLGKSSDAYMKQFSGGDEYWDRVLAVQRERHPRAPAKPDASAVFEPVHGWTKRQLAGYLARNPDYRTTYEAKLQKHPHDVMREFTLRVDKGIQPKEFIMSMDCAVILKESATPEELKALGIGLWRWSIHADRTAGIYQFLDNQPLADLIAGTHPPLSPMGGGDAHIWVRDEVSGNRGEAIQSLRQQVPAAGIEDVVIDGVTWDVLNVVEPSAMPRKEQDWWPSRSASH